MREIDLILQTAKENNGTITAAMAERAGFSRGSLKYLTDRGRLEKVSRGIYILPGMWEDEFFNLQARFKRGIFSRETALFLWDLTDRTPDCFCMTFPSTYNLEKPKNAGVRCSQIKMPMYDIGITRLRTPGGNQVNGYNMERTLCDILKASSHVDIQVVTEAFRHYVKRQDRNIPRLSEYGVQFKVEKKLRAYLEVLL